MTADGLDDAIVGVVQQNDGRQAVLYDCVTAIEILKRTNQWDDETALEWFEFNVMRAQGAEYPCFLVFRAPLMESAS